MQLQEKDLLIQQNQDQNGALNARIGDLNTQLQTAGQALEIAKSAREDATAQIAKLDNAHQKKDKLIGELRLEIIKRYEAHNNALKETSAQHAEQMVAQAELLQKVDFRGTKAPDLDPHPHPHRHPKG